jgi:CIC family chloride channel protein
MTSEAIPHNDRLNPAPPSINEPSIDSSIVQELAPPASDSSPNPFFNLTRLAPKREERLFLVLSIFIGIISGLLVVCFRVVIEWIKIIGLGSAPHAGQYRLLYIPALAGIIVGAMVQWIFPQARGSGVNQTKAALYIYNGYISFKTMIGKFLTAAIAIGGGHSLGPEDPSLQIGAGVASVISRHLNLSRERLRLFAPIGAAAGLAAAFNAPISAILFVIEEVIGKWSAAVLGSIVLSAISSVVVMRQFWGAEPMFRIPSVTLRDPRELTAYVVLGIFGGLASFIFSKSLGYLRPRLHNLPHRFHFFQPAIAGLLVGLIGFVGFPQVMGPGYEVIDQAAHGQFTWKLLLILALLKILATTLSFSSGTPGGMFAPTLFIGAMLGASVGTFEKLVFPHLTGGIGSYALVGMGVLFAGFIRAPLTSVFMVLEVSGNYSIILPVILANTTAYLISRVLTPVPIFEIFTHQDGLDLPSMEEQREEVHRHIEDALRPVDIPVLDSNATLAGAASLLNQPHAPSANDNSDVEVLEEKNAVLIRLPDDTWYVLSAIEIEQALNSHPPDTPIEKILPLERVPLLFPDMPLDRTLPHFSRWVILPVRNRASKGMLEGIVTSQDVLKTYEQS